MFSLSSPRRIRTPTVRTRIWCATITQAGNGWIQYTFFWCFSQCCQRNLVYHRPPLPRQLQFCGKHKTGVTPTKSKSYRQILQKCFFLGLFGLQSAGFLLSNNYQEKSQFFRILFRIECDQKYILEPLFEFLPLPNFPSLKNLLYKAYK